MDKLISLGLVIAASFTFYAVMTANHLYVG
jgi:hypothetical protein